MRICPAARPGDPGVRKPYSLFWDVRLAVAREADPAVNWRHPTPSGFPPADGHTWLPARVSGSIACLVVRLLLVGFVCRRAGCALPGVRAAATGAGAPQRAGHHARVQNCAVYLGELSCDLERVALQCFAGVLPVTTATDAVTPEHSGHSRCTRQRTQRSGFPVDFTAIRSWRIWMTLDIAAHAASS